jgi:hypothetical protein
VPHSTGFTASLYLGRQSEESENQDRRKVVMLVEHVNSKGGKEHKYRQ